MLLEYIIKKLVTHLDASACVCFEPVVANHRAITDLLTSTANASKPETPRKVQVATLFASADALPDGYEVASEIEIHCVYFNSEVCRNPVV